MALDRGTSKTTFIYFVETFAMLGTVGGAVVSVNQFGVPLQRSFESARNAFAGTMWFDVLPKDIFSGLAKSFVFGISIGGLSCAAGMKARGGALGVGRAVRSAVVSSVLLILILGYLMTWMFWA